MHEDDRTVIADLTTLADDLLEQASEIRRQWAELGEALGVDLPAGGPAEVPAPSDVAAVDPAAGAPTEPPRAEEDPVRLVALDMMLSGRSREDIDSYLRQTFGDAYHVEILDEVFDQYR
jgi:hypothetical protein